MKLFFVRHGETDWESVESRGAKGWAKDFAPLTPLGRLQIDTIARDYRLQEAEAILCSTFTRALESAALLSRAINKPLYVEHDLHEWLPQKDPLKDLDPNLIERASRNFDGRAPKEEDAPWESVAEVRQRVLGVLKRYRHFNTVVVVTHGVVIGSIVGVQRLVDHAEIVPYELDFNAVPEPAQDHELQGRR